MSDNGHKKSAPKPQGPRLAGYLVEFETPGELMAACEKVRDAGYSNWDAHSPFPVHGLNKAMGLGPTILPWLVMGGGVVGCLTGLGIQWWTNGYNYQFTISGKPFWSIPSNIPVTFELTVLFAALTAFLSMIVLNGFPRFHHPVFSSERFRRATTDRFFLSVEAEDPSFDAERTASFLKDLGGVGVEALEVDE
jgi:hypothetical protein